jgi:hypothetical protein
MMRRLFPTLAAMEPEDLMILPVIIIISAGLIVGGLDWFTR